jgi:radical SAM-linked protein
LAGRELTETWEDALESTGLPLHRPAGRPRPRIAFAAPLQVGIEAEAELAEVLLAERVPIWRVREAVLDAMPPGWSLVDLFDVWVGGAPLAGRVVGAEYRIEVDDVEDAAALAECARDMLRARELPRTRQKGETTVRYDLRPLVADVVVVRPGEGGAATLLRVRTRIHPELGTGRPEEIVAELGDRLGHPLGIRAIVRERLIIADEPPAQQRA